MQILKLKTSQPKNILNIIINKNILKHPIEKIFNNNYLKFKIINNK